MNITCGFSTSGSAIAAVEESTRNIKNPKFIIFFSKVAYFKEVTNELSAKFPNAKTIGCSSIGEISPKGINEGLTIIAFYEDVDIRTLVMENINEAPVVYLNKLKEMVSGFNNQNTIAFEMTDGLSSSEEKVLSVLNAVFEDHNIPIVGASAADDLSFTGTYVACDGKIYANASVVALIHSKTGKIKIYKENIYKPTNQGFIVTKSNPKERKVYELDGKPIKKVYAEYLHTDEANISNFFMSNPIGRVVGNDVSISSFKQIESDNSLSLYCRIYNNSYVNILEPEDPMEVLDNTIATIKSEMPKISGTIVINCIFRTLLFKQKNLNSSFVSRLGGLGEFIGLSSYGEQIYNKHVNQTMLLVCFE